MKNRVSSGELILFSCILIEVSIEKNSMFDIRLIHLSDCRFHSLYFLSHSTLSLNTYRNIMYLRDLSRYCMVSEA